MALSGPGSLEELQGALVENLNARGIIPDIKARLQSEVLSAMQRDDVPVPRPPPTALLINDLIREYLAYTGYLHSLSTFNLETGHVDPHDEVGGVGSGGLASASSRRRLDIAAGRIAATSLPRAFLADELGVVDVQERREAASGPPTPLLYALVGGAVAAARGSRPDAVPSAPAAAASASRSSSSPATDSRLKAATTAAAQGPPLSHNQRTRAKPPGPAAAAAPAPLDAAATEYADESFESDSAAGGYPGALPRSARAGAAEVKEEVDAGAGSSGRSGQRRASLSGGSSASASMSAEEALLRAAPAFALAAEVAAAQAPRAGSRRGSAASVGPGPALTVTRRVSGSGSGAAAVAQAAAPAGSSSSSQGGPRGSLGTPSSSGSGGLFVPGLPAAAGR